MVFVSCHTLGCVALGTMLSVLAVHELKAMYFDGLPEMATIFFGEMEQVDLRVHRRLETVA